MTAPDPAMPPVRHADLGAIRMAYHEAGPADGLPVVLCHGFPELAYSWRFQIPALAADGWRTIAPDQRGYGGTSRPAAVEAYDAEALCDDLARLLDHLGVEQAVFAGHDWGGALVWDMAMRRPDRVAGVIGLNTPFQARAPADPIEIMRKRLGEEMYIVHFQKPGEADAILDADVRKTLSFFFRKPSLEQKPSKGFGEKRAEGGPSLFPLVRKVEAYDPARDRRATFLSDEAFETYVAAFQAGGFTGPINWYRNITRNWQTSAALEHVLRQPALMIMAEQDAVLPPSAADGMEARVPNLEKALIKDSGHWTQQEQPEAVNRVMLDWLRRRFR